MGISGLFADLLGNIIPMGLFFSDILDFYFRILCVQWNDFLNANGCGFTNEKIHSPIFEQR
jgi:hypothetical protein